MSLISLDFFRPAAYQPVLGSQTEIIEAYRYWRIRICYSILFGYAVFYFTRKSFSSVMPYLMDDLGFSKGDLGKISSFLFISYAISKLISGVISDRSNPRYFMAVGLILTGFFNILFGLSSSLWLMAIFWALNGWFQAWGWPACCKQLNYWYEQSERGLWYSICTTSHTVGGAIIPILAVYSADLLGWRYAMFIPAIISILMGGVLINRLRDVPRSIGLPTVEEYKSMLTNSKSLDNKQSKVSKNHNSLSVREILFHQVLNNKYVWIFGFSYFFVYVVRTAINDWTPLYLMEMKGIERKLATTGVSWFEIGGLIGMVLAGWGSDYFWRGNRIPIMVFCAIGLIFSLLGLKYLAYQFIYLDMLLLALIGFFVFGPQMIVGLAAAEFVDKRAASTSNGFVGTFGYLGAAVAGYPMGEMLDAWGWSSFFLALVTSAVFILLILFPIWIGEKGKAGLNKVNADLQMPTQNFKEV